MNRRQIATYNLAIGGLFAIGGLADRAYNDIWLMAAIVSSVLALACDVSAAHRAVLLGSRAPSVPTPTVASSARRSA
jgi:hypothetical protein